MSTKQIETIKIPKEKLEQDINDSWAEFLTSNESSLESPKNIFTKYIKEAFSGFMKLEKGDQNTINIGKDQNLFYDFALDAIICAQAYTSKEIQLKLDILFGGSVTYIDKFVNFFASQLKRLYITQDIKSNLSENDTISIIKAIYHRLPKEKNKNYIGYVYGQLYNSKLEKKSASGVEDGSTIWIFDAVRIKDVPFNELFYKFIKSNLIIDELKDNNAYKILQIFEFKEGKFIVSNLEHLQNLKIDKSNSSHLYSQSALYHTEQEDFYNPALVFLDF